MACHFAGEYGNAPDRPVTTGLLGVDDQGNPDGGSTSPSDLHDQPGYADTWFDLDRNQVTSA